MIKEHIFAPGMQLEVWDANPGDKIRIKCHSKSETTMIMRFVEIDEDGNELPQQFPPASFYVDTETVIVSFKFAKSGVVRVVNAGEGILYFWCYDGEHYGAA